MRMKLYLSSEGFGNHLKRLQQMVGSDRRVLFVDNAKDCMAERERAKHVAEKKAEFEAAGFDFFELDLRRYFRSPESLKPIIDAAFEAQLDGAFGDEAGGIAWLKARLGAH